MAEEQKEIIRQMLNDLVDQILLKSDVRKIMEALE